MADDHTTLALRQKADLDLYLRLARIFKPWAMSEIDRLYPAQGGFAKFVHYTSAVAALQIIKHKRLWLRSTTCMSDYREVRHGYELLREVFSDAAVKDTLTIALDGCSSGLASESFSWFDKCSAGG